MKGKKVIKFMAKTKREYFAELRTVVADNADLVAFIDHEVELLDKKNSAPKNPTAKQIENEGFKDMILANLAGKEPMTCGEIQKTILGDYNLSNQRVSAIVKQLVEDNSVVRTVKQRKAYFSIAD